MATITSVGDGLWSAADTWSPSGVPANGDTVIIADGHTVTFDVDQSGFADGVGLTINGTLRFTTDGTVTYLKLNANLAGTGSLYVGNSTEDPIPAPAGATPEVATIAFNGAYRVTGSFAALEMYGEEREPFYAVASKTDNTHIVLAGSGSLSWLREGDVIAISDSTTTGQHDPPTETFTVSGYDANTRTITLDAGTPLIRDVNQDDCTDYCCLISHNIQVIGGSTQLLQSFDCVSYEFRGIHFSLISYLVSNCFGAHFDHCSFWGYTFDENSHISMLKSCVIGNASWGGFCARHGGIATASIFINIYYSALGFTANSATFINCVVCNVNYGAFGAECGNSQYIDCVDNGTSGVVVRYPLNDIRLHSCLLLSASEIGRDQNRMMNSWIAESLDHDQVANAFRAWCRGGVVNSCADPVPDGWSLGYQHVCESADYPVWRRWAVYVPAGWALTIQIRMRKDTSMSYLPRVQVIDQYADPLVDDGNSALAEQQMTNANDEWESYELTYENNGSTDKPVWIRSLAKNASGNFYVAIDWENIDMTVATNVSTLLTRLSADRAEYLDNLSAGPTALASVCTEERLGELDAANLPSDIDDILADTGTDGVLLADSAITAAKIATSAITADKIAADAIGASELASDAVSEIADAVWDEATADHVSAGSFGKWVADLIAGVWAYATRTLTQSAASVTSAVSGTTISVQKAVTWSISLSGLGALGSYDKLYFTVKTGVSSSDDEAIVQIEKTAGLLRLNGAAATAAQGSLTVDDAVAGDYTITVSAVATAQIAVKSGLKYDLKKTYDGTVTAVSGVGTFNVTEVVTLATS